METRHKDLKIIIFFMVVYLIWWGLFRVWFFLFGDLPEVTIDNLTDIAQKTIVTDRDDNLLYTFFEEDRTYTEYKEIPDYVTMAFLSTEDRNYREHRGLDTIGLIRAVINNASVYLGNSSGLQWASTIPQQLTKNMYLTNERSYKRKFQELVITRKIYRTLEKFYTKKHSDLEERKIDLLVRKKIIELYMNLIFLGNNSYGVDIATQNYFGKELKDITLLESAILWWLPKAPSAYNPLAKKTNMMWDRQISDGEEIFYANDEKVNKLFLKQIKETLDEKFELEYLDILRPDWITFFWEWEFINNDVAYQFQYVPGRKDVVLWAMFQEWYITHAELINAFLEWIDYEFAPPQYRYTIESPHFVFFVREFILNNPQLEELGISLNDILRWWYTIKTTLDLNLQKAAQIAADTTRDQLQRDGATTRGMLHVDSANGDILSYLWSVDYYDSTVDGQFDIIQAYRQQWSVLKPFVYAKLMETYPVGIDGNILDAWLDLWPGPTPNNADGWFMWSVSISRALNNSRNRTAIRAHLANGGEKIMRPFYQSLWLTNIPSDKPYGYTMSLWAAEESLFHLAQAYLQLSTPHDQVPYVNPILSITDPSGEIIYQKWEQHHERIVPKGVAYQIRNSLKRQWEVSPYRQEWITYSGLWEYAIKSGTSDVKINGVPYAKDGLVAIYNPAHTIVSRWGNLDSKPLANNMLWSMLNKPFVQRYIDEVGENIMSTSTTYTRPNDLLQYGIYKDTKNKEVPDNIARYLWGY